MRHIAQPLLLAALFLASPPGAAAPAPAITTPAIATSAVTPPPGYDRLVSLYAEWRRFAVPDKADYSPAAMARQAAGLAAFRSRLAAIDRSGWPKRALTDHALLGAEMNGLDFDLRVLKPWARDPSFYANVFGEESDVPAHEGPSAAPSIDLFRYRWPLSRADDHRLTALLAAVPASLATAKTTLADSQAHDLWAYGDRAFKEQSATLDALDRGVLTMRTLAGPVPATMTGASPALRTAIRAAKAASDEFAVWVATEAPKRTGPSGVGKAQYDWHARHVQLSPYGWDEQVLLLRRELDRALASLRLEETRNRDVPAIVEITDPAAYRAMAEAKTRRFNDFLIATGLVPDRPYFRAALEAQTSSYVAPDRRDFFSHGTALDPLPLLSHSTHWIELARIAYEPNASPLRRAAPLYNIYADRSEGFATAMEEIVMQAGLYDDVPHGRELVWIMLANRAARGLASLYVQSNDIDLARAGRFHAEWTPRHWSNASSRLVGFEQLLYARQPGYGTSYIVGKVQLDALLANASHAAEQAGKPFVLKEVVAKIMAAGIVPPALIAGELDDAAPAP